MNKLLYIFLAGNLASLNLYGATTPVHEIHAWEVPDAIRLTGCTIEEGETVPESLHITLSYVGTIWKVTDRNLTLLRNGEVVRYLPFGYFNDMGVGIIMCWFSSYIHWQSDVEFSIVLPGNTVFDTSHPSVALEEFRVNFIGGWNETLVFPEPLEIHSADDRETASASAVELTYDVPVGIIGEEKRAVLLDADGNSLGSSKISVLSGQMFADGSELWTVNVPVNHKTSAIEIPEASIVTLEGDVIVNEAMKVALPGGSSVNDRNAKEAIDELWFTPTGIKLATPQPGLNIRICNGVAEKVMIRKLE